MGVIMGKIIMRDTENQTQLILQAGDEKSLIKQVEGIDMLERKAKAFDEILKLEKETSLYSIVGKEDVELGTEARKIINKYMEDK